jgi:hypothetical protein
MAGDHEQPEPWLTMPALGASDDEMAEAGWRRSHDGRPPPLAIDQRVADARGTGEWVRYLGTGRLYRRSRRVGRLGWT